MMSKHLQQLNVRSKHASQAAGVVFRPLLLKANILLVLVLVIIPTLSGVDLIA
jgi:hypothetical protein